MEGLEQEECAERMDVARSTVQRMYSEAKRKVADSIVNGKVLRIEGGDYILCELDRETCILVIKVVIDIGEVEDIIINEVLFL